MWSLSEFVVDESIPGDEVYVLGEPGEEMQLVRTAEALAAARASGHHLFAVHPVDADAPDIPVSCVIGPVRMPLEWEEHPAAADDVPRFDERLWFLGTCGERDYLLDAHGHTFTGRMSAWCPKGEHAYNVSKSEMGEMSVEAQYFVRGFLTGNEPGPYLDAEFDTPEDDWLAWRAALAQFHRTGYWRIGWATCESCGRVLLPGSVRRTCESHTTRQ
jgi:hypothetical protein